MPNDPSNPLFNPAPERLLLVIDDLLSADLSLREVAARHNTTLAALSLWMSLPETISDLDVFHTAHSDRVRLIATANLDTSVSTINRILARYRATEHAPDPALTPEERSRAQRFALRAATLMVRLAHFRPPALGTPAKVPTSAARTASSPQHPAPVPTPAAQHHIERGDHPNATTTSVPLAAIEQPLAQPQPTPDLHQSTPDLNQPAPDLKCEISNSEIPFPSPSVPYIPSDPFSDSPAEEELLALASSPHEHWP